MALDNSSEENVPGNAPPVSNLSDLSWDTMDKSNYGVIFLSTDPYASYHYPVPFYSFL